MSNAFSHEGMGLGALGNSQMEDSINMTNKPMAIPTPLPIEGGAVPAASAA